MKPAVVHYFDMPKFRLASVVMDLEDFNGLCDSLTDIFGLHCGHRVGPEQIAALKTARHIPLMALGTKTKAIFDRYGIKGAERASFIVRGHGQELVKQLAQTS